MFDRIVMKIFRTNVITRSYIRDFRQECFCKTHLKEFIIPLCLSTIPVFVKGARVILTRTLSRATNKLSYYAVIGAYLSYNRLLFNNQAGVNFLIKGFCSQRSPLPALSSRILLAAEWWCRNADDSICMSNTFLVQRFGIQLLRLNCGTVVDCQKSLELYEPRGRS